MILQEKMEKTLQNSSITAGSAYSILAIVCLYITAVVAAGIIKPDYSHMVNYVSELGVSTFRYSWLLNTVLIMSGISLSFFAFNLHKSLPAGSVVGPVFVLLWGFSMVAGGIFPLDEGVKPVTFSGWMHVITGFPALIALLGGPLFIGLRMKKEKEWHIFAVLCFIIAGLTLPVIVINNLLSSQLHLDGLGQRIQAVVQIGWAITMALGVITISKREERNNDK